MHLIEGRRTGVDLIVRTGDEAGAGSPRVGLRPEDVVCSLKRAGAVSWTEKKLTPANWQDAGHGVYVLTIDPEEFEATGPLVVLVEGAVALKPSISPVLKMFDVLQARLRDASAAAVRTQLVGYVATGALKGKPKAQVIIRPAVLPLVIGGVVVTNEAMTIETDDDGRFEFDWIAGATINVQIPFANYQRQFVVPPPPAPGMPVVLFSA